MSVPMLVLLTCVDVDKYKRKYKRGEDEITSPLWTLIVDAGRGLGRSCSNGS